MILLTGSTIYPTTVMDVILIFEPVLTWWENLGWKGSEEYREMIRQQLKEHDDAMKNGGKSPYFG